MAKAAMMIHGFLTDKNDFGELYGTVKDRYDEVFLCEIPGHNENREYDDFTVEATIDYVEKHFFRLRAQYDELDLYGYSMGGALCTYLASKGGVSNVMLYAPANKYLNPSYIVSGFVLYYRTIKDTLAESTKEMRVKNVEMALETYLDNTKISMDIAIKRLMPYYNKHTLLTFARLIRKINASLKPWKARTCIFWGKCDQMVPRSSIEFLSEFFIDTEHYVKIYEDYSHLMLTSKEPERLIEDTLKFLNEEEEFRNSSEEEFHKKQRKSLKEQYREAKKQFVPPWYKITGGLAKNVEAEVLESVDCDDEASENADENLQDKE